MHSYLTRFPSQISAQSASFMFYFCTYGGEKVKAKRWCTKERKLKKQNKTKTKPVNTERQVTEQTWAVKVANKTLKKRLKKTDEL